MDDIEGVVGLTGPMGAGKSTITGFLREEGVHVIDVDVLVKNLYSVADFQQKITSQWLLDPIHDMKAQMGHIISHDPDQLPILEAMAKPYLDKMIEEAIINARKDHPFVVLDFPLLYESGWDEVCDYIILVTAPRKVREERVMLRPGMTHLKMLVLMDRQLNGDDPKREEESAWTIDTSCDTLDVLRLRVQRIANSLKDFHR